VSGRRGRGAAAPPVRQGRWATITAVVLTIAVPGVGHLYLNLLLRGVIWLAGNIALVLILRGGDVSAAGLAAVLGALRVAALADLLLTQRAASRGGPPGDR